MCPGGMAATTSSRRTRLERQYRDRQCVAVARSTWRRTMNEPRWFVGIDWASKSHRICLLGCEDDRVRERDVSHDGAALNELCAWLLQTTGASAGEIAVAIETPRGPLVELLLERGFEVF